MVLKGKPLDAHGKFNFNVPSIQYWKRLKDPTTANAKKFITLVEKVLEAEVMFVFHGNIDLNKVGKQFLFLKFV
jgi:hypothetical protein